MHLLHVLHSHGETLPAHKNPMLARPHHPRSLPRISQRLHPTGQVRRHDNRQGSPQRQARRTPRCHQGKTHRPNRHTFRQRQRGRYRHTPGDQNRRTHHPPHPGSPPDHSHVIRIRPRFLPRQPLVPRFLPHQHHHSSIHDQLRPPRRTPADHRSGPGNHRRPQPHHQHDLHPLQPGAGPRRRVHRIEE